jgi:hypothetical protein
MKIELMGGPLDGNVLDMEQIPDQLEFPYKRPDVQGIEKAAEFTMSQACKSLLCRLIYRRRDTKSYRFDFTGYRDV